VVWVPHLFLTVSSFSVEEEVWIDAERLDCHCKIIKKAASGLFYLLFFVSPFIDVHFIFVFPKTDRLELIKKLHSPTTHSFLVTTSIIVR
jgi:hypothetical protein